MFGLVYRVTRSFRTLTLIAVIATIVGMAVVAHAASHDPAVVGVWQGPDMVNGEDHGVVTMALTVESGNRLLMYHHDTKWGFCDKTEGVAFSRVRWNAATQLIEGAGASHLYCFDGRIRRSNIFWWGALRV